MFNSFSSELAILIPCYNEELTIGAVIDDYKRIFPQAKIYVFDNNSTDKTSQIAHEKGVIVKQEYKQGKGNVVRSMFRQVEANIYLMVDGDNTYPAESAKSLVELIINNQADMAVGDRHSSGAYKNENKRPLHNLGNNLVTILINNLFKAKLYDVMSGCRAFSRDFVKGFPVLSSGFEIETEMTLFALDRGFLVKEMPINYKDRPSGSFSKLNTYEDGFKVLKTIFILFKDYKPLYFFSIMTLIFFAIGLLIGLPVIIEFIQTQYVKKVPSAILASSFMIFSALSLNVGLILDTITKQHRENYELMLNRLSNE